ncbi:MAG: aldehyde ferredoxin oxidoreductase N-terminal domain-containing protein [Moorellales bacterium]
MPGGVHGRLLRVDLSSGAWGIEDLPEEMFARYPGGQRLGAHLLLTDSPAGADPLGPENPLIFAVGLAAWTRPMSASRHGVVARWSLICKGKGTRSGHL